MTSFPWSGICVVAEAADDLIPFLDKENDKDEISQLIERCCDILCAGSSEMTGRFIYQIA